MTTTETTTNNENPSGGSAYDDLTLMLGRVGTLLYAIERAGGDGGNIVSLIDMAQDQLTTAERICQANAERWHEQSEAPVSAANESALPVHNNQDEEQAMMDRDEEGPALDLFNELGVSERELRDLLDGFPNRPLYDASAVLDDEARRHLTTAASALQFVNHCILQAAKRQDNDWLVPD